MILTLPDQPRTVERALAELRADLAAWRAENRRPAAPRPVRAHRLPWVPHHLRCRICFRRPKGDLFRSVCNPCGFMRRRYYRKRGHWKAWRPGGRGMPPAEVRRRRAQLTSSTPVQ